MKKKVKNKKTRKRKKQDKVWQFFYRKGVQEDTKHLFSHEAKIVKIDSLNQKAHQVIKEIAILPEPSPSPSKNKSKKEKDKEALSEKEKKKKKKS